MSLLGPELGVASTDVEPELECVASAEEEYSPALGSLDIMSGCSGPKEQETGVATSRLCVVDCRAGS